MKVQLDNAQGVPKILIVDSKNKERIRIYFCIDGAIVQFRDKKTGRLKSIGTEIGHRHKSGQAQCRDARIEDGLVLGEI